MLSSEITVRASTITLFPRTGLPGYIGWRNRFLGSLNVYKFGLWFSSQEVLSGCMLLSEITGFCPGAVPLQERSSLPIVTWHGINNNAAGNEDVVRHECN
jgi:hypothetical protein